MVSKDLSGSSLLELLINFRSWYGIEKQPLSATALVRLSMSNTEGETEPGTVFFASKDVKAVNSKCNRIICFERIKLQSFQDHLITGDSAHTRNKLCCSPLRQ